jgi:hypothetical protein
MADKIFAAISMLAVIAFVLVVTVGVMEPDLWIVSIVVIAVGVIFFVQELREGGSHFEDKAASDEPGN